MRKALFWLMFMEIIADNARETRVFIEEVVPGEAMEGLENITPEKPYAVGKEICFPKQLASESRLEKNE
jgi:hypothetical protein